MKAGGTRIGLTARRILAAYLLVLQAALAGLAVGASPVHADPATILCGAQPGDSGSSSGKDHGATPACCVVGCQMHGGGMAPPPLSALAAPSTANPTRLAGPARYEPASPVSERTPRATRAPPV